MFFTVLLPKSQETNYQYPCSNQCHAANNLLNVIRKHGYSNRNARYRIGYLAFVELK